MLCPHCDGPTKVVLTVPANKRTDKRHYRNRKCKACGKGLVTLELPAIELRELDQRAGNRTLTDGVGAPLPTRDNNIDLLDIESELETLLRPSLDAINEVLTSDKAVSRYKAETARWLVADRREYRRTLAEQHGAQESDDPSIRELARVLALVPDPMTGTDGE